jgi:histidinol phosphatase-like PHP family hydrolase
LRAVGPFLEGLIRKWLEQPQEIPQPDELRRNFFTWPEAEKILQKFPDWKTALRGDLQMHTEWSDGSGTVRSMAEAAIERGYSYIAITDHGKKLKIAGGMNEEELQKQGEEIGRLNEEFVGKSFRILRSIEMNLDPEGNGDMTPEALAKLDIVLGAFHSSLRRTEDQTERYLAALRNPTLHILGHPRGRIYNYRLGLKADWGRVFAEAARLGKAVEIDCYPDRQDLSLDLIKKARDAGAMISLGTDSHHPWQLEFIDLGLAAAAQAKVPKEKILNFMDIKELLSWVNTVRHRAKMPGKRKVSRNPAPNVPKLCP